MATDRSDARHLTMVHPTMRFRRDATWARFGRVVVAGSPLRIFRVTQAGAGVLDAIEGDRELAPSMLTDRLLDAGAIHPVASRTIEDDRRRCTRADVTVVTPQLGGSVARDGRLVVDDGSHPPLDGAALRLAVNAGPAAARNAGRRLVETELVAFVDADVDQLDGSWLDVVLPHFDDDRVGLVAPRVTGERDSPIDLGDAPARIRAGTRVSYVPGAAVVVRVAAFDDVGGFDERLRFGEDVDLVWRLDQRGWGCRYEPAATVWHEPRPNLRARLRQHAGYGTSAAPLALRHPRALSPLHVNAWTLGTWAVAALGHPFAALTLAGSSAAALVPKLPDLPATWSIRLALTGHLRAGRQMAEAIRRVWWPLAVAAAVLSRRARRIVVLAVLVDIRATPTDAAYGWGVWRGMWAHRSWTPIVPRLQAWPGGAGRRRRGRPAPPAAVR